jgi:hypothetical protein
LANPAELQDATFGTNPRQFFCNIYDYKIKNLKKNSRSGALVEEFQDFQDFKDFKDVQDFQDY